MIQNPLNLSKIRTKFKHQDKKMPSKTKKQHSFNSKVVQDGCLVDEKTLLALFKSLTKMAQNQKILKQKLRFQLKALEEVDDRLKNLLLSKSIQDERVLRVSDSPDLGRYHSLSDYISSEGDSDGDYFDFVK